MPTSAASNASPGVANANRMLVLVSLAVFLASSTWFTGTAVMPLLRAEWSLTEAAAAWLTISTQIGFIAGTVLFSVLSLSDVFNPRRVFLASALLGAFFNAALAGVADGFTVALGLRFLTGVTLAGVYPVGMKIVASWFQDGLGWRLGVMVGALTLGTAAPYLLKSLSVGMPWHVPVWLASGLAAIGGVIMIMGVDDGPFLRDRAPFDASMLLKVFRVPKFRYTSFGYFGHMWELYAFWALVGSFLSASYANDATAWSDQTSLLAFFAVGIGALGCVAGGWISRTVGERRVATGALIISGTMAMLSAFAFELPPALLAIFILIWGVAVVADSPQFSALAARYCPPRYTGTALTVQNGVGFAVTILTLQLTPIFAAEVGWKWAFLLLVPGPIFGLWAMRRLAVAESADETYPPSSAEALDI